MFLITTADERTWSKDQPVLFLGEWCKHHDRRNVWMAMNAGVVPYHWDDRKKLHQDYLYLKCLYEELLFELSEKLNEIHSVNHTLRYWRIMVGPWLGWFIQMLFDRWVMIRRAVVDYSIDGVRIMDTAPEQVIPQDMDHFNVLFLEDAWNEAIYGQLLQGWTSVPIEKVHLDMQSMLLSAQPVLSPIQLLKRKLVRAAMVIEHVFTRDDEAFFMGTYLPRQLDFSLQWRMGQVPKLWSSFPTPKAKLDWTKRQWQWQMEQSEEKCFPAIARAMIPRHIPLLYVEGYAALQSLCESLPWPKKPRLIFTSNSAIADDVFKAWAAEKVETAAPLVIGQHGGTYGIGLLFFSEDHEYSISDSWLSWGWSDKNRPQINPVGNIKMPCVDLEWDPGGHALMVEMAMPRQCYHMYSVPMAGQWLDYFEEQIRFVKALPDEIRKRLLVRLYAHDYGWNQTSRWRERFPELHLDDGRAPITPIIKKSRIYVSTYNATTFLESLAMNIPTIMFWNPNHWEFRESALPYFERLKRVGVFHETPESAAHKMVRVWHDVPDWWNRPEVQAARQFFCEQFSRTIANPIQVLKEALTTTVR